MGPRYAAAGPALMPPSASRAVVASLPEALAAIAAAGAGATPELWSPPDAAGIHGVLWFVRLQQALDRDHPGTHQDARADIVLDCGDRADLAIEALRGGLRRVALTCPDILAAKVADIAAELGGEVLRRA